MPAICTCFSFCEVMAKYLSFVTKFWWVRGVIYLGMTCGAWALYVLKKYVRRRHWLAKIAASLRLSPRGHVLGVSHRPRHRHLSILTLAVNKWQP